MLIGQRPPVQLQIELSIIGGGIRQTLLQLLHKTAHRSM